MVVVVWAASPTRPRRARRGALSAALLGELRPRALSCGLGKRTLDLKVMLAAFALMRADLGAGLPRGSVLQVLSAPLKQRLARAGGLNTRALHTRRYDDDTTIDTYNKSHRRMLA